MSTVLYVVLTDAIPEHVIMLLSESIQDWLINRSLAPAQITIGNSALYVHNVNVSKEKNDEENTVHNS